MSHSIPRARPAGRPADRQRGGTVLGLILGLLIGLAVALGVALYIAKVPVPFVDKVPHRTTEQDAAELERNKNWDPNAPLAGKQAGKGAVAEGCPAAASAPPVLASAPADRRTAALVTSASAPQSSRDAAAILAGQMPGTASSPKISASGKPDPFIYFVQAGAYSNADDAEQQRARLAMDGVVAKVSEREQSGRTVYRVRLGPFDAKDEAESNQERLKSGGSEAVLVRVERPH